MPLRMTINPPWYRIKAECACYPWPCGSEPDRMLELYRDDVLTRDADGTYTTQTGIGKFGVCIPEQDVEEMHEPAHLTMW